MQDERQMVSSFTMVAIPPTDILRTLALVLALADAKNTLCGEIGNTIRHD